MRDEEKELFKAIHNIYTNRWLNSGGTEAAVKKIISTVLASGLNEATKPAIKYYIEFWGHNGEFKHRKETDYNYRVGNLIDYEHARWVVRVAFTCEDEGQFRVTFQADQVD